METSLLVDGPEDADLALILAHGAGAPMDSPFMDAVAAGLATRGVRVTRFEFPYMRQRRQLGSRRPPDRQPVLLAAWREVLASAEPGRRPFIGGKSLGGRMASLIADEAGVRGLICLGYPFHPPGKPERLRTAHLEELATPALIVQGERDPFGTAADVAGYRLAPTIRFHWCPDGDHGLKPRKRSGHTFEQNLADAMDAMTAFMRDIAGLSQETGRATSPVPAIRAPGPA